MNKSIGDKSEAVMLGLTLSALFSVLAWLIVDNLIVDVSYLQSLAIEGLLFLLLKLYIFISRKAASVCRD